MNTFAKTSLAVALGAAVLASSVSASSARNWRPYAAGAAGFVAGAAIASAAANANRGYYNQGYAYQQPGYAYGPDYGYSGYAQSEPSYGYGEPYASVESYPVRRAYRQNYRYHNNGTNCVTDTGYGRTERCN